MADSLGFGGGVGGTAASSALDRQTDSLLHRFGTGAASGVGPKRVPLDGKIAEENRKIEKSAGDFEAILLGSWLQQAEKTFAEVPGGDAEDGDADPGKEQLQELSVQSLAGALSKSGGIGLAKMISAQLKKSDAVDSDPAQPDSAKSMAVDSGVAKAGH